MSLALEPSSLPPLVLKSVPHLVFRCPSAASMHPPVTRPLALHCTTDAYLAENLSLIVTNASAVGGKTYEPAHPSWNGVRPGGNMGTISMKTDSKAVFKFAIVDAETHEPVCAGAHMLRPVQKT